MFWLALRGLGRRGARLDIPAAPLRYSSHVLVGAKSQKPLRLVDILKALPEAELASLVSRLGVRIDAASVSDPPQQIARALVALPHPRCGPLASRERRAAPSHRGGARHSPRAGGAARAAAAHRARDRLRTRREQGQRRAPSPRRLPRAATRMGRRGPSRHPRAARPGAVRDGERDCRSLPRSPGHHRSRFRSRPHGICSATPTSSRRRSRSSPPPSVVCSRASSSSAARWTPRSSSSSNASRSACARPRARRRRGAVSASRSSVVAF